MIEVAPPSAAQSPVVLRILPFALIIVCGYLPIGIPLAALPLEVNPPQRYKLKGSGCFDQGSEFQAK